ncbi:MAG: hypothetical protein LBU51_09905, partial [Bacteroidales bacterium]|nr:hypothetical protein [Bacteroidales bacterium]
MPKAIFCLFLLVMGSLLGIDLSAQGKKVFWSNAATSNVLGNTSNWRIDGAYGTVIPVGIDAGDTLVFAAGLNAYNTYGKILVNQAELHVATILVDEPGLTLGSTVNKVFLSQRFIITQPLTLDAPFIIDDSLLVNAPLNVSKELTVDGDITVNERFMLSVVMKCHHLTVNDSLISTSSSTTNVSAITGNLTVNQYAKFVVLRMEGTENATIMINPDFCSSFLHFYINKPSANVVLLSDLNLPTTIIRQLYCAHFSTQRHNIDLSQLYSGNSSYPKDFTGTTLILREQNVSYPNTPLFEGKNNILDSCDIIIGSSLLVINVLENEKIHSITFRGDAPTAYYSSSYSDTIGRVIVETPSLALCCINSGTKSLVFIKDSLIFNQPSTILTRRLITLALKDIKFSSAYCSEKCAIDGITRLRLFAIRSTITTTNINYVNIDFIGGAWSASEENNLGRNSGNITWIAANTQGRSYYWVGEGGLTNDPTHWAVSSGGTPQDSTGCLPSVMDTIWFDNNSCASLSIVKVPAPLACKAFFVIDENHHVTLKSNGNHQISSIVVFGSANLSGISLQGITSINLLLLGSEQSDTLITNSEPFLNRDVFITFSTKNSYTVIGDIKGTASNYGSMVHESGLLRSHGNKWTLGAFKSIQQDTLHRGLDFQNDTIAVNGYYYNNTLFEFVYDDYGFVINGNTNDVNYWNFDGSEINHVYGAYY